MHAGAKHATGCRSRSCCIENGSAIEYRYAGIDPGNNRERGIAAPPSAWRTPPAPPGSVLPPAAQLHRRPDHPLHPQPAPPTPRPPRPGVYTPADADRPRHRRRESLTAVDVAVPDAVLRPDPTTLWVSDKRVRRLRRPGNSWPHDPTSIPDPTPARTTALYPFWDDLNLEGAAATAASAPPPSGPPPTGGSSWNGATPTPRKRKRRTHHRADRAARERHHHLPLRRHRRQRP